MRGIIVIIALSVLLAGGTLYGQCRTCSTQNPPTTLVATDTPAFPAQTWTLIADDMTGGQYALFTLQKDRYYEWTTCNSASPKFNTELTILVPTSAPGFTFTCNAEHKLSGYLELYNDDSLCGNAGSSTIAYFAEAEITVAVLVTEKSVIAGTPPTYSYCNENAVVDSNVRLEWRSIMPPQECTNCNKRKPDTLFADPVAKGSVPAPDDWTLVSSSVSGGDYMLFDVVAGNVYEWSTCDTETGMFNTQLTLRAEDCENGALLAYNNDSTDPACGSTYSSISWYAPFSGTVALLVSQLYCRNNWGESPVTLKWRKIEPSEGCGNCSGAVGPWAAPSAIGFSLENTMTPGTSALVSGIKGGATYEFSVCGSSGDTQLTLRGEKGNNAPDCSTTLLAYNDNGDGQDVAGYDCGSASKILWTAPADFDNGDPLGGTVLIALHRFNCQAAGASATLRITKTKATRFHQFSPDSAQMVVNDNMTNLFWTVAPQAGQTWQDALDYCSGTAAGQLNNGTGYAGYKDWRLPSINELTSILDFNLSAPATSMPTVTSAVDWFWSTTTYIYGTASGAPASYKFAWIADLREGKTYIAPKNESTFTPAPTTLYSPRTLCVRDTDLIGVHSDLVGDTFNAADPVELKGWACDKSYFSNPANQGKSLPHLWGYAQIKTKSGSLLWTSEDVAIDRPSAPEAAAQCGAPANFSKGYSFEYDLTGKTGYDYTGASSGILAAIKKFLNYPNNCYSVSNEIWPLQITFYAIPLDTSGVPQQKNDAANPTNGKLLWTPTKPAYLFNDTAICCDGRFQTVEKSGAAIQYGGVSDPCDDGNGSDTDNCVWNTATQACTEAACHDGYKHATLENCDSPFICDYTSYFKDCPGAGGTFAQKCNATCSAWEDCVWPCCGDGAEQQYCTTECTPPIASCSDTCTITYAEQSCTPPALSSPCGNPAGCPSPACASTPYDEKACNDGKTCTRGTLWCTPSCNGYTDNEQHSCNPGSKACTNATVYKQYCSSAPTCTVKHGETTCTAKCTPPQKTGVSCSSVPYTCSSPATGDPRPEECDPAGGIGSQCYNAFDPVRKKYYDKKVGNCTANCTADSYPPDWATVCDYCGDGDIQEDYKKYLTPGTFHEQCEGNDTLCKCPASNPGCKEVKNPPHAYYPNGAYVTCKPGTEDVGVGCTIDSDANCRWCGDPYYSPAYGEVCEANAVGTTNGYNGNPVGTGIKCKAINSDWYNNKTVKCVPDCTTGYTDTGTAAGSKAADYCDRCGDGRKTDGNDPDTGLPYESCDKTAPGYSPVECSTLGSYWPSNLPYSNVAPCSDGSCTWVTNNCDYCGNGYLYVGANAPEVCDPGPGHDLPYNCQAPNYTTTLTGTAITSLCKSDCTGLIFCPSCGDGQYTSSAEYCDTTYEETNPSLQYKTPGQKRITCKTFSDNYDVYYPAPYNATKISYYDVTGDIRYRDCLPGCRDTNKYADAGLPCQYCGDGIKNGPEQCDYASNDNLCKYANPLKYYDQFMAGCGNPNDGVNACNITGINGCPFCGDGAGWSGAPGANKPVAWKYPNGIPLEKCDVDWQPLDGFGSPDYTQYGGKKITCSTWCANDPAAPRTDMCYNKDRAGNDLFANCAAGCLSYNGSTCEYCGDGKPDYVTSGLVAYYTMDNNAAKRVWDSSGNNLHGELTGAPTLVSGKRGNGISFTASPITTYARILSSAALQISAFTIEAWVKYSGTHRQAIISKGAFGQTNFVLSVDGNYGPPDAGGVLGYNGHLMCKFEYSDGTGGDGVHAINSSNGGSYGDDNWHHVVCTYGGGKFKIYVDGEEKGSRDNTKAPWTSSNPIYIGGWNEQGYAYYTGAVDNVRIYNRALNDAEVKANYRSVESCDDGDIQSNDGCSSSCTMESGWKCSGSPSTCSEATCTHSVALFDTYYDSGTKCYDIDKYYGTNLAVDVNGVQKLANLYAPNLSYACSWGWWNYDVPNGQSVYVHYHGTSNQYPSETYFVVQDAPNGGGDLVITKTGSSSYTYTGSCVTGISLCGNGVTNNPPESCDLGANNGAYCTTGTPAGSGCTTATSCNDTCTGLGPRCGDGTVQTANGETCDDGGYYNNESNDSNTTDVCLANCQLGFMPKGHLDTKTRASIAGWACDKDNYSSPVEIYLNFHDGNGVYRYQVGPIVANQSRSDVASSCGGNGSHGFNYTDTASVITNYLASYPKPYKVDVYARNNVGTGTLDPNTTTWTRLVSDLVIIEYCGNTVKETSETCDSNTTSCDEALSQTGTTGTVSCNGTCDGWVTIPNKCTKINVCPAKPATGTVWNLVDQYTRTWLGLDWDYPADSNTNYDNAPLYPNYACQYTCATNYTWLSGSCQPNGQQVACAALPIGAQWNDPTDPGILNQIWNGSAWTPAPFASYSTTPGDCNYTCSTGYSWDGAACSKCGDSMVTGTEQCDDGKNGLNDACKDTCQWNICGDTVPKNDTASENVLFLPMNENAGTALSDYSGKGNNGTASNTTWVAGVSGSALSFNGTSSVVTVPSSANLQLSKHMTVSFWMKTSITHSDWVRLVGKGSGSNRNFGMWLATNGTLLWQHVATDGSWSGATTAVTVNNGAWRHIVGTYDGVNIKIYVDGIERASQAWTLGPITTTDPITIGYGNMHGYFNGQIDDVRIYNRALLPAEITNGKVWLPMDVLAGTTAYDLSGNGANGTISGATAVAGRFGNGLNFNGTSDTVTLSYTPPTNDFTMEAWVKPTATHEIDAEANNTTTGTSGQRYLFGADHRIANAGAGVSVGTNGVSVYEHGDGYMPPLAVWQGTLSSTAWTHVVVTYTAKQPRIYINGSLVRTGLSSPRPTVYAPTIVGGGPWAGYFSGGVDGVRIYDKALTATEVKNHYEYCDDGNGVNTDDCKNDCTPGLCGDSVVMTTAPAETCDNSTTACSALGIGATSGTASCNTTCNGWNTSGVCQKSFACSGAPSNAVYYSNATSYSYTQTWYGSWSPADGGANTYAFTPSEYTCQYKCASNAGWNQATGACLTTACNNSSYPYLTFDAPTANNNVVTISAGNQFRREYNTMNNTPAGKTYISSFSTTCWITVRYGSVGGQVVAAGNKPLTWTAPAAGTYYIHYNTNSSCGTSATGYTSTIQCTNCP